ncbi:uncharacterized protein [Maniola hyperantus]|uniref:uncharacterized protein n=1 Tax=Aphantopus hyperantus TaxID=2795564 RepID=UPI0037485F30
MTSPADQQISILEDTAQLLQKAKINLKKCPKERLTKGYLESRIKSIDEYWQSFKQAHQDLIKCTTREQRGNLPYFVNEEFYVQEDLYLYLQGYLKDLLELKTSSSNRSSSANDTSTSTQVLARLPKIQLPTFDGKYEEWPTFQDLFVSLVHKDTALTNVQKLHYLKTSITGEAAALLNYIQITDDNYSLAWDTLKNRYGSRRLIVKSLLKRLFLIRKSNNNIQSAQHLKTLLDTTSEVINSLRNQKIDTDSWDPILIYITVQKLDQESHKQWEDFAHKDNVDELPTWEDLSKFLETKFRTLELVAPSSSKESKTTKEKVFHVTNQTKTCVQCKGDHTLGHCKDFLKLSPVDRGLYVKENNICFNCLSPGHTSSRCRVPHVCKICHKRHSTLLHQKRATDTSDNEETTQPTVSTEHNGEIVQVNARIQPTTEEPTNISLLATALVKIRDDYGHTTVVRALVDTGSQASFVSERAVQALRLKRKRIKSSITGIGSTRTPVKQATELYVLPRHEEAFKIKTYIMPTRLTSRLPTTTISNNTWPHLKGLVLADPSFSQPGRVDMLLGVDVCARIMKGEFIKGPPGTPSAQNTSLGWILFGTIQKTQGDEIISMHLNLELDNMQRNMWEQDTSEVRKSTQEERKCEEIYKDTTTRTDEGRYIVEQTRKIVQLQCTEGKTRDIALERRLKKDTNVKNEYVKVIEEYKDMSHMEEVTKEEIKNPAVYRQQGLYKDDLMSGKDNLKEAMKITRDIDSILQRGSFVLQKKCRSHAEFLKQVKPDQSSSQVKLGIIDGSIRALGLQWKMGTDKFQYNLNLPAVVAEGEVKTTIIAAKTRVASVRSKSLPRLELNSAVLLADLLKQIQESMKIPTSQMYAWTNAAIVLSWLLGDPARWNTYVRNRVVEIPDNIGNHNWCHVQSQDNPADIASRERSLAYLKENKMWWKSPEWLSNDTIEYCRPKNIATSLERKQIIETNLKRENKDTRLTAKLENCDNLTELLKVITCCKRFLKGKKLQNKDSAITPKEVDETLKTCIKIPQQESFKEDISYVKANGIQVKGKLKTLQPYLDDEGIVRVGGRLRHEDLSGDGRHPIKLDHDIYLSKLVDVDARLKTLHGRSQLMFQYLRQKYWILKSRNLVKVKFRKCLICVKQYAATESQLIEDLPHERIIPSRPFLHSAV